MAQARIKASARSGFFLDQNLPFARAESPDADGTDSSTKAGSGRSSSISDTHKTRSTGSNTESDESKRARDGARIAAMVMNMKHTRDETRENAASAAAMNKAPIPTASKLAISHATAARAHRARVKLELQYGTIERIGQRFFEDVNDEDDDDDGPNFDPLSCYNPLQTIRNRAVRRYQRQHTPLATQTEPSDIADEFASVSPAFPHGYHWYVDPTELIKDYGWRSRNFTEMRDRKGRKIFGPEGSKPDDRRADDFLQRIRGRLGHLHPYTGDDSDSSISKSELGDGEKGFSARSSRKSASEEEFDRCSSRRTGLDDDRPARSPSPVRNVPIESVRRRIGEPGSPSLNGVAKPLLGPPGVGDSEDIRGMDEALALAGLAPQVDTNAPEAEPEFKGIDQDTESAPDPTPRSSRSSIAESIKKTGLEGYSYLVNRLKYLDTVLTLEYERQSEVDNGYKLRLELALQNPAQVTSNQIKSLIADARDRAVPNMRGNLDTLESEVGRLQHDLSSYSVPELDSILAESDQIISQVSTTYNLELRKTSERIDRLSAELPGLKWLWTLLYDLLEWLLILSMWLVWSLVSMVGVLRSVVAVVWAFLRWLMWC